MLRFIGSQLQIGILNANLSFNNRDSWELSQREKGKMRILVIDDEPDVREVIAMLLRCWGHDIVQAHDGVAGIRMFKPGEFDLVTTDDNMPGIGGEEVIQRLREIQPDIPILMITAYPTDLTIREYHADVLIPKPFTINQLKEGVAAVVGRTENLILQVS